MKQHAQAVVSLQAWPRRFLSLLLIVGGFWLALDGVTDTTGWAEFWAIVGNPAPIIGLSMAVIGAVLTTGKK